MAISTFFISLAFLVTSIIINRKKKILTPMTLFYSLWTFILFLSMLNLYNIYKPSNEAYLLILLMLIFFGVGYIINIFISNKKNKDNKINKEEKEFIPRFKLIYILCFLILLFNLIDIIIIILQLSKGTPMWQIRNWTLEPVGSNNPILSRRSFIENVFRNIILSPFASIVPPITAYYFFNGEDKKQKRRLLIISVLILITSSISSGGGRLNVIYYLGCFLITIFITYKNKSKNIIKKYKKNIIIGCLIAVALVIIFTISRVGIGKIFKQIYTYFALPPTLLSVWLPELKNIGHTYGMTTFFGIHSYIFRVLDTIGLDMLVPQIYHTTYTYITNAEIFREVGYGLANAFVTPVYYFFIDGGYPFVCLASLFFGYIVSKITNRFEKNINIKTNTIYLLVMFGVFLTFARVQTVIPAYFISFIFAFICFKSTKKQVSNITKHKIPKEKELISIVVPIYNVEEYLNKCIDSILNQTYDNLEILLIDDGSKDDCGKICDEYAQKDKRIKVTHKENGGLSDARNIGIEKATGTYITFVDSDDFIDNNYIELLYSVLKYYDADISIASHRVLYEKVCFDKSTNQEYCTDPKTILEKILYDDGIDISIWGKLFKTNLFENIRFPKGRLFEDAATTYKLVDASKKIAVCSLPVYNYVIRGDSITTYKFSEKKLDLITSTEEMTNYIIEKYPELESGCRRRMMNAYLSTLTQLVKTKDYNKDIGKKLLTYIKENKKVVLKDKRIPKRDRFGIYSTTFGIGMYQKIWNIYSKITKRT